MKIGPATGTFLHVAQQHGHRVRGCDVSGQFRAYAMEHYGVEIDHGRFERQPYADGQFDAILLLNVIENVPNQVELLQAIQRTLKPGGYFILNFVDMRRNLIAARQGSRYFLFRPPVCYAYPMPVMRRILDRFGFEVVEMRRDRRVLNVEKMVTLLGWKWALKLARALRVNRWAVAVWAYPSWIVVARRRQ
jgi:SAM-dependent methyltransferase